MHLIQKYKTKAEAQSFLTQQQPGGAGLTPTQAEHVAFCELWGSSFTDPGPDYCEVRVTYDDATRQTIRIEGY